MNNKRLSVFLLAAASSVAVWADTQPIVLVSPPDYQVLSMSPNGKWATGVYSDYAYAQRGFLWNLESNTIELLSTSEESSGWAVANDGTVCGSFTDHSTSDIGAGTAMPGYYRDGQWHSVEVPQGFTGPADNYHGAGQGYAISADGTTIAGALYINGQFSPAVWHEGQLVQMLNISNDGMQGGAPYCISADGTLVGGWCYRDNRSCTIWNVNTGARTFISEEQSPWASVNRFSPDGKKVIYGGGWDESIPVDAETQYYYSIYDVETGEATSLPAYDRNSTVLIFGISNSYTCVGSTADYDAGRAIIYPNGAGPGILMTDYLYERGVDFSNLGLLTDEEVGYMLLFRAQDISADDNIFCLLGYDQAGMRSIIVMLNQDSEHAAPLEVKARQLAGITTAELTWSAPVRSLDGIQSYRIYRDEQLIAEVPATCFSYYDQALAYDTYTYAVSTLYADGTEMRSSAPSLHVLPLAVAKPEGFNARQKGVYSLLANWNAPGTNLINKSWFNSATSNLRGFGIAIDAQTIELGIGFQQAELANYAGYNISKVNFFPMSEQSDWVLNIYRYEGENLVRIYSQPITQELRYKERNSVILDQPVAIPTDADVVVAIEVMVPYASMSVIGMDYGRSNPGFGDLLRLSTEPDFYSYYYATLQYGYPEYATFMIEAVLTAEGQDLSADEVLGYRVSVDGEEVATVTDCSWQSGKVSQQSHTLAVQALFADGKVSDPVTTSVDVSYAYKSIDQAEVTNQGSEVTISWEAPVDDDLTTITYARGNARDQSIIGPAENNYGFLAGAEYDQTLLLGYEGYQITSFRFFPLSDATFTFLLYADDQLIAEVPADDYELGTWNTVYLDEPITVEPSTTYLLALDCYDVEPESPALAIDNRLPITFSSDLVSLDGYSWSSITVESGLSGNWMMGMNIAESVSEPLPVEGYDVMIDNAKKGDKVTDTTFSCDLAAKAQGGHNLRINTYYEGRYASVKGALLTFYIDPAGIAQPLAETYRLQLGTQNLCVLGNEVSHVAVLSADGRIQAQAKGNQVGIASLPAGVYMVVATAAGQTLTYKVVID